MVNIDTVYQKVLALANKEQRGYITPQDFNLFADQAQMEIFEQYFYDTNIARRSPGNDTQFADVDDMLEEKIQIFSKYDDSTTIAAYGVGTLPSYIYRVEEVIYNEKECEILNVSDYNKVKNSTGLLAASNSRPVVNISGGVIKCIAQDGAAVTPTEIYYICKPLQPSWTYVVINKKAMFNGNSQTQNFELHASEENNLISKILMLAGVSIKQQDIMSAGQGMDMSRLQQQPKI
jgi:hypothetical protein